MARSKPAKYSHVHCSVQKRLNHFFRCWMEHSKKIGQIWADHLVECVVQEESKLRDGRFHPELDRSSRREKNGRRAVFVVNWYPSEQNSQLRQVTEQPHSGCLDQIYAPVGTTSVDPLGVLHALSLLWSQGDSGSVRNWIFHICIPICAHMFIRNQLHQASKPALKSAHFTCPRNFCLMFCCRG